MFLRAPCRSRGVFFVDPNLAIVPWLHWSGVRTKMSEEGWRLDDWRFWLLLGSSGLTKISGNLDTSMIITLSFRENLTRKYFHEKNSEARGTNDSFPPPINCQSESWTDGVECLFIFIFVSVWKCGLCPECQLTGFTNVSRWQEFPASTNQRAEQLVTANQTPEFLGPFIKSPFYYGRSKDVPLMPTQRR